MAELIFFFFYTSNLQGLTIQEYKNKKNSKIQVQNKTQTLRKPQMFLNKVCTCTGHININNNNDDDDDNNNNNNNNNNNKIYRNNKKINK